jgi:dsRNA-specific ribonuclease
MKYLITESQYNRLVSKMTGINMKDESYLGKLLRMVLGNQDKQVGDMILKSVEDNNYEFIEFNGDSSVDFNIKGLPFTIFRNVRPSGVYIIKSNLLSNEPLKISSKVLKKIFYSIAKDHMDVTDYVLMSGIDSLN